MAYNTSFLMYITETLNMDNAVQTSFVEDTPGQALDLDAIYFTVGGLVASWKITCILHNCHSVQPNNMAFIQ